MQYFQLKMKASKANITEELSFQLTKNLWGFEGALKGMYKTLA